jgi:type I restriction enzyme S subunit
MGEMVPEGWESKSVDDVIKFTGGAQPPRSSFIFKFKKGYVRLLQIRDYKSDKFETYIPEELSRRKCNADDVLIGRYGPPIFQILRGKSGSYNVALIKAEPLNNFLLKNYMYYFLKRSDLFHMIDSLSQRTSGQTGIDLDALKSFGFPLPPLPEQKKIASILTFVDEVIETTQKQIDKLQDLKKATMNELLTKGIGHTEFKDSELGRIPKSWEVYELGQLCIFTQGVQISLDETLRTNQKGYIRYLYINDFSSDKNLRFIKDEFPTKIVKDEDLVMANTGHSAGTIFRGKHGALSNNAFKISIKKYIKSEYLFHFLSTDNYWFSIGKLFNTAGQPHVGHGNIAKLQFLCPPLNEQDKIISIIHKIDQNIFTKQRKLAQTQALKKSLMQDLLTGKVRVQVN